MFGKGMAFKRPAEYPLDLPLMKRPRPLSGCEASLGDHNVGSDEIGMNLPKWRALLQPSRDWEHGVPRFPYNGASVFTHNCGQGQTTSASHAPSVCADCAMVSAHPPSPAVFVPSQGRLFPSLGEAVRHARTGDVIRLQPGVYVQTTPIVLACDGVHIVAEGCDETGEGSKRPQVRVLSHTQGQDSLVSYARGCEIRGIRFEHTSCLPKTRDTTSERTSTTRSRPPADSTGCMKIESGDLRILACSISNCSGYGIKVTGASSPHIESSLLSQCHEVAVLLMGTSTATMKTCHLSNNLCAGIVLLDSAGGELAHNTIAHNEKCGIVCAGSSSARLVGNAVLGGNGGGVWIRERSEVVLEENLIALSLKVSLQVSDDSTPTVQNNRIIDGCNGGIVVHGCAGGVFRDNVISGHNKAGLGVTDTAHPRFESNTVLRNRAGGAIFTGQSRTEWNDNVVDENLLFGMHVRGNALMLARGGSISLNTGPGVQLQEEGHARMLDACISGNLRAGAIAVGHATLELTHCIFCSEPPQQAIANATEDRQNESAASVHAGASDRAGNASAMDRGRVAGADAQSRHGRQQRIGVQVAGNAHVDLVSSRIEGHAYGNLVVQANSTCKLEGTSIARGTWAGVVLQGSSHTTMDRVHVRDARSAGVLCMDHAMLTASGCEFVDGKGIGLLVAGSSRAVLMRSSVLSNAGTGITIKESACADLRRNRISGNGLHGVTLEGPCTATAIENAVFENGDAGILSLATPLVPCDGNGIGGVPMLIAFSNIVVSSSNPGSVAVLVHGHLEGLLSANTHDSMHFSHEGVERDADNSTRDGAERRGNEQQAHVLGNAASDRVAGSTDAHTAGWDASSQALRAPPACLLQKHETLGNNVMMGRGVLAALLCNQVLPLNLYGHGSCTVPQCVVMPDGSTSLAAPMDKHRTAVRML